MDNELFEFLNKEHRVGVPNPKVVQTGYDVKEKLMETKELLKGYDEVNLRDYSSPLE